MLCVSVVDCGQFPERVVCKWKTLFSRDLLYYPLLMQGDNYRRGDGFSTTRSVKKVSVVTSPNRKPDSIRFVRTLCVCLSLTLDSSVVIHIFVYVWLGTDMFYVGSTTCVGVSVQSLLSVVSYSIFVIIVPSSHQMGCDYSASICASILRCSSTNAFPLIVYPMSSPQFSYIHYVI